MSIMSFLYLVGRGGIALTIYIYAEVSVKTPLFVGQLEMNRDWIEVRR
jgi:hypothetical protein